LYQITSGVTLLEGALSSASKTALQHLQTLKVNVKLQTKVLETTQLANGRQELTLTDGQKIVADLYVSATGVKPNSSYVPANLLDSKGFVIVDEYLRVKGVKDVWVAGDVSAREPPAFLITEAQAAHVAKNVLLVLSGKEPVQYGGHVVAKWGIFISLNFV
jgi:NADH dehydrogenase FAD-containing subunit